MNEADLSFYSTGFTLCFLIMASSFTAAGVLFFKTRRGWRRRTRSAAAFTITEHIISVHTDYFIE